MNEYFTLEKPVLRKVIPCYVLLKYKDSAAVVESRVRVAYECSSCHKIRPYTEYDSPMS